MRRLIHCTFSAMVLSASLACMQTKDAGPILDVEDSLSSSIAAATPKVLGIPAALPPELRALPPALVDILLEACRDEQTGEFNPLCVAAALSSDRDCDGMTLLEEIATGRDPASALDGPDRDCDGLTNDEDPDIDDDGVPNEDDPDVDADRIPNDEDDDVDNDGLLNEVDFDVDGDFLLNRWDIDDDADGKPDPEDDDEAPDDCDNDDDDDAESEDDDGAEDDESAAPPEGIPAAAISTVSRLKSLGGAAQPPGASCDPPSAADKTSALRQGARALGRRVAVADLSEMLRELEEAAQNAPANEDQPSQEAIDALDALIAMLDQSLADSVDPQQAADQLQDRVAGVQQLADASAADDALAALAEMIDALADNDSSLRIAEQAAVVAAVARQQPDEDLAESAADAVVLIAAVEEAGADPGPAADVYVPLAAATGALSDYDVLSAIVGATLQVANDTGSSIRQTAKVIELLTFRLDDPDVDSLAASAGSLLRAANDRGVNPFDVLEELDDSGADLSDGVSDDEAGRAADAVAAVQ